MRMASVEAETCTLHYIKAGQTVLARKAIPVTLTLLENGGFTFTYDPDATDGESVMWVCEKCVPLILPKIDDIKELVQEKIVGAVELEQKMVAEEAHQEEHDEEGTKPSPEGDVPGKPLGNAAGPTGALGPTGEKIVPQVSNPAPGQSDPEAKIKGPGQVTETDLSQPRGAEKTACERWFIALAKRRKDELAPNGWPARGSLRQALVIAWRMSEEYKAFSGANAE